MVQNFNGKPVCFRTWIFVVRDGSLQEMRVNPESPRSDKVQPPVR